MTGIEINERTEMFDMRGEVPMAYPPGHVYIIGEHEPEPGVLEYVCDRITRQRILDYCVFGSQASLWEKAIRMRMEGRKKLALENADGERIPKGVYKIKNVAPMRIRDWLWSYEKQDDPNLLWKDSTPPWTGTDVEIAVCATPAEMAEDITAQLVGRFQPKCYVMYDDRDLAFEIKRSAEKYVTEYRGLICEMLVEFGTFEFGYFKKDFVVSIGEKDILLGQLGREVSCETLEKALDLPVFNDWTLVHLWCRLQGQVGHWMKAK